MDYMIYFNFFGCVLLPLFVMLVIYAHIFMAARHQLHLMGLKVTQAPVPGEINSPTKLSRYTLTREVHAAKSLAIIVGLFGVCWLPLHIINCINYFCQNCERTHIWVMNIAIILSHANSVVNPFIYAYRIREFRQTFRRIMYQHILGRDGHRITAVNIDGQGAGINSIVRTSSQEGSLCSTVMNSYVLDPITDQTPPVTTCKSSHWIPKLDAVPSSLVPNGHQVEGHTPSTVQPRIMGFAVEDGIDLVANMRKIDAWDTQKSRSCIAFVNVKHTGCVGSTDLSGVL